MHLPRLNAAALSLAACAALALSAPPAAAQGTVQSGTTYLQFTGTPLAAGTGNANLFFGSNSAFATDMLYRYGWSYNQGVGTTNRPFSALDTPAASYSGNVATFTWTNAGAGTAGFARWDAVMTITLTELAAGTPSVSGQARVDTALSFRASSGNAAPINFNLFHELDLDITGSSGPGGDTFRVLDANAVSGRAFDASGNYAEFLGTGAQRYLFATGAALRSGLNGGSSNLGTLAGTVQPDWASSDGAVGFQWGRTLAPGEAFSVSSSFTINSPVPEPGTWALMAGGLLALCGLVRPASKRRKAG